MIEARDFSVTYHGADAPSLTGIDVDIAPGRFTLVTGPTGSGKSTLLMGLGGILQHESSAALLGRVLFEGTPIGDIPLKHLCQKVGWVFQNPAAQICTGTPEREVAFGLENLGTPRVEMTHRIAEALSIVGLEKERHQKTHTLSGGQQQRLVIASALSRDDASRARMEDVSEPVARDTFELSDGDLVRYVARGEMAMAFAGWLLLHAAEEGPTAGPAREGGRKSVVVARRPPGGTLLA